MAYAGSGTQLGGGLYAAGQLVWTTEWVVGNSGALYTPPFRLTGVPNLSVRVINDMTGITVPPPLDVVVTLRALDRLDLVSGDLVGSDQYPVINEPVPLAVPPGQARSARWDRVPYPLVIVQVQDNREIPTGPFPLRVSIGATG